MSHFLSNKGRNAPKISLKKMFCFLFFHCSLNIFEIRTVGLLETSFGTVGNVLLLYLINEMILTAQPQHCFYFSCLCTFEVGYLSPCLCRTGGVGVLLIAGKSQTSQNHCQQYECTLPCLLWPQQHKTETVKTL